MLNVQTLLGAIFSRTTTEPSKFKERSEARQNRCRRVSVHDFPHFEIRARLVQSVAPGRQLTLERGSVRTAGARSLRSTWRGESGWLFLMLWKRFLRGVELSHVEAHLRRVYCFNMECGRSSG